MFKPLIFIPSPRDLPLFHKAINRIHCDKYWVKYTPYKLQPYRQAHQFFLEHSEYTHFVICPDDLYVTPEGVDRLFELSRKYPVIMGICNMNNSDYPDGYVAMTKNLPVIDKKTRVYQCYKRHELTGKIMTVPWCGTPFAVCDRKTTEKLDFTLPEEFVAGGYDVLLANQLHDLNIPLRVDSGVFFRHDRVLKDHETFAVGKKLEHWIWEHDGEIIIDPTLGRRRLEKAYQIFSRSGKTGLQIYDELLDCIYQRLTSF